MSLKDIRYAAGDVIYLMGNTLKLVKDLNPHLDTLDAVINAVPLECTPFNNQKFSLSNPTRGAGQFFDDSLQQGHLDDEKDYQVALAAPTSKPAGPVMVIPGASTERNLSLHLQIQEAKDTLPEDVSAWTPAQLAYCIENIESPRLLTPEIKKRIKDQILADNIDGTWFEGIAAAELVKKKFEFLTKEQVRVIRSARARLKKKNGGSVTLLRLKGKKF